MILKPCRNCNGQGRVRVKREIKLKIDNGVDNGFEYRLQGQGEVGASGGTHGDLLVVLHIAPHDRFKRSGNDLITSTKISFVQAVLGCTIEVNGIDGQHELVIPAGTQYGDQLRIQGKGMPRYRSSSFGDLVVHVGIETPRKITDEQRKLLENFDELHEDTSGSGNGGFWDKFFRLIDDKDSDK